MSGVGSDRSRVTVRRRPEGAGPRERLTSVQHWSDPLRRTHVPLLVVLWAVSAFFVVLSFAPSSTARSLVPALDRTFPAERWGLSVDGGIPEFYGYAMQAVIAGLLVILAVRARAGVLAAWAAVYLIVLLDDSLRLHEDGANWLGRTLPVPADHATALSEDLGELIVWGVLGLVPLLAVLVLHRRSEPGERSISRAIALLFALLIFCAVVLDAVHAMFGYGLAGWFLAALEDGGELLTLGLTVAFAVGMLRSSRVGAVDGA